MCIVSDSNQCLHVSEKADRGGYKNGYPIAIFTLAILDLFCVTINYTEALLNYTNIDYCILALLVKVYSF